LRSWSLRGTGSIHAGVLLSAWLHFAYWLVFESCAWGVGEYEIADAVEVGAPIALVTSRKGESGVDLLS
jgi:hypothetical protein